MPCIYLSATQERRILSQLIKLSKSVTDRKKETVVDKHAIFKSQRNGPVVAVPLLSGSLRWEPIQCVKRKPGNSLAQFKSVVVKIRSQLKSGDFVHGPFGLPAKVKITRIIVWQ